jgi:hypothetical protein
MKKILLILLIVFSLAGLVKGQENIRPAGKDTILYISKQGTRYKMIVIGDKIPELYVNNKKVGNEDLEQYSGIIGFLQQKLEERRHKAKYPKS